MSNGEDKTENEAAQVGMDPAYVNQARKEKYEADMRKFGEMKETTGALNALRWVLGCKQIPLHIRAHINEKAASIANFINGSAPFDPKALEYNPAEFIVYDEKVTDEPRKE